MGEDHPTRFEEQYSTDDVLGVFADVPGPAIVPGDVKDALGCSGQTARNKLEELRRDGRIEKREKGRVTLWWRVDDEEVADDE